MAPPSDLRLLAAPQGDGTAQLLCKDAAAQAEVGRILTEDFGMSCMPFTVPPTAGKGVAGPPATSASAAAAPQAHANGGAGSSGTGLHGQLAERMDAVNAKQKELAVARQRLAEVEVAIQEAAAGARAAAAAAEVQAAS